MSFLTSSKKTLEFNYPKLNFKTLEILKSRKKSNCLYLFKVKLKDISKHQISYENGILITLHLKKKWKISKSKICFKKKVDELKGKGE
jgi:hypothetical protein